MMVALPTELFVPCYLPPHDNTLFRLTTNSRSDISNLGKNIPAIHAIPLFLRAQTLPFHFSYYKLLAETMHDVSNDVIPSQLKDLFIPTVKIHSYNT